MIQSQKIVTDIRGAEMIPFKGININGVSAQIQNKSLILDKEFTIFHVGTKDIPHLDKGQYWAPLIISLPL